MSNAFGKCRIAGLLNEAGNPVERDPSVQKSLNRDFICGVQDGWQSASGAQGVECDAQCGKALEVRTLESELSCGGQVEPARGCHAPRRIGKAVGNWDFHIGRRKPGSHRAVCEGDKTMNQRLGMNNDIELRSLDSE